MKTYQLHSIFIVALIILFNSCERSEVIVPEKVKAAEEKSTSPHVTAEVSSFYTSLFDTQGGGWTGGDGAYSLPLPDGRVLWTFGDTFLGTVNPDYSRPPTGLINNTFVIQDGNQLTTLYGGTESEPLAYVLPPNHPEEFYWPGDGTVIGNKVYMFMLRVRLTDGGGSFGFETIGTDVAVFSLPNLELLRIEPLAFTLSILPGVSIYEEEGYIYCYSTKASIGKDALAARTHVDDLRNIEYWNGTDWGPDFVNNAFMLKDDGLPLKVSNMFSVFKTEDTYRLLTQQDFGSGNIQLWTGDSPVGPWRHRQIIYVTPEAGNGIWTYNASLHPHIQHPEKGMLLTYSVNNINFFQLFDDVRDYRPRFVWVRAN